MENNKWKRYTDKFESYEDFCNKVNSINTKQDLVSFIEDINTIIYSLSSMLRCSLTDYFDIGNMCKLIMCERDNLYDRFNIIKYMPVNIICDSNELYHALTELYIKHATILDRYDFNKLCDIINLIINLITDDATKTIINNNKDNNFYGVVMNRREYYPSLGNKITVEYDLRYIHPNTMHTIDQYNQSYITSCGFVLSDKSKYRCYHEDGTNKLCGEAYLIAMKNRSHYENEYTHKLYKELSYGIANIIDRVVLGNINTTILSKLQYGENLSYDEIVGLK